MASSAMLAPAPTHAAGVAHVTGTTALAAAPVKHPFRVLVVDDNPINRQMLLRPLRKAGFDCLEACDGLEATCIYAALQPALVLMDITMPVMDGWAATREIRNWELASTLQGNGPQQRARIVATTTLCADKDLAHGQDVGMDDWLVKPIKSAALVADVLAYQNRLG